MMDEKEPASSSEPVKTIGSPLTVVNTEKLAVANTENLYEVNSNYSEDLLRIDCDGEVTLSDKITVRNIASDFNLNQCASYRHVSGRLLNSRRRQRGLKTNN